MSIELSVIIPTYNSNDSLHQCLMALSQQSLNHDNYEVIVIDNGSDSPLSESDLKQYLLNSTLKHQPKVGSYAARNMGISHANGNVLAFTDADCVPDKNWLKCGLDLMKLNQLTMIGGRVDVIFVNEKPTLAEMYDVFTGFPQEFSVTKRFFAITANMFTNQAVFKKIGLFNENLKSAGDAEWGFRAYKNNIKQLYAENAIVYHPARTKLSQLLNQARRTEGGRVNLYRQLRINNENKFSTKKHSFKRSSTLTNSVINILKYEKCSFSQRLQLLMIGALLRSTTLFERLRLAIGGQSLR